MKLFFFDCGTRDPLASTGIFLLRAGFGLMMLIGHGLDKWGNFSAILAKGFPSPGIWPLSMMSPWLSLIAAIVAEVLAASLLILGLATRQAAFVLGFAMVVAAFQVHAWNPFFTPPGYGPAKEVAVLYLISCFVLIVTGGGKWSFDATFNTEKRRRRR